MIRNVEKFGKYWFKRHKQVNKYFERFTGKYPWDSIWYFRVRLRSVWSDRFLRKKNSYWIPTPKIPRHVCRISDTVLRFPLFGVRTRFSKVWTERPEPVRWQVGRVFEPTTREPCYIRCGTIRFWRATHYHGPNNNAMTNFHTNDKDNIVYTRFV